MNDHPPPQRFSGAAPSDSNQLVQSSAPVPKRIVRQQVCRLGYLHRYSLCYNLSSVSSMLRKVGR